MTQPQSDIKRNVQWAAGLFEGEGWTGLSKPSKGTKLRPGLALSSVDRDVVEEFGRIVGHGSLNGPYTTGQANHQPYFRWTISRKQDIVKVLTRLRPYLFGRRLDQADAVLAFEKEDV